MLRGVCAFARPDLTRSGSQQGCGSRAVVPGRHRVEDRKACEPPKAQKVKALQAPDMTGKRSEVRARSRKAKEKTRPTEMRAQMNKRAFAHTLGGEYGDDSMGLDFGLLGKEGGNLRATQKKENKPRSLRNAGR